MGYMGLNSWIEVDGAADSYSSVVAAIINELNNQSKEKGNENNPDGCINVALIIEDLCFENEQIKSVFAFNDSLITLAKDLRKSIKAKLSSAKKCKVTNWPSRDEHIEAYERLIKKLSIIIKG